MSTRPDQRPPLLPTLVLGGIGLLVALWLIRAVIGFVLGIIMTLVVVGLAVAVIAAVVSRKG
ncbi:MAG: hypothetical protein S0880_28675 [Actinomycetota bacterium]|nr:hypothetical protein [Actinomycetota bacterium]